MAARAAVIGDTGENSPDHWEKPLGGPEAHVLFAALAPDRARLDTVLETARSAYEALDGVATIWQDCYALPSEREAFGFRDGISHPAIEGSGVPGTNPKEPPLKAGEFILGYADEMGFTPPPPKPEVLGRNGAYAVVRKLRQRVSEFRRFLKAHASSPEEEEWLAAKMMGRWRSGAPLALSPNRDDPELGADRKRNNDFLFYDDDKVGFKTPPGSHIRRMNPRDALKDRGTSVRIRRMIRRGTSYGPELPAGVLDDDGAERGLMFVFLGADLKRQFEFVQATWLNDGEFIGAGIQTDPMPHITKPRLARPQANKCSEPRCVSTRARRDGLQRGEGPEARPAKQTLLRTRFPESRKKLASAGSRKQAHQEALWGAGLPVKCVQ